jgi:hypothetical protein
MSHMGLLIKLIEAQITIEHFSLIKPQLLFKHVHYSTTFLDSINFFFPTNEKRKTINYSPKKVNIVKDFLFHISFHSERKERQR